MSIPETITSPSQDGTAIAVAIAGDLPGIVWQVWTAYLQAEPTTAPAVEDPSAADVTASICIAGVWAGHVVLHGTREAATAIAAAMMELQPDSVTTEDITDTTGELLNIVAGNVKSLLPQPSFVSLPQVVLGRAEVQWPGTASVHRLAVRWDEHVVTIELLRGEP